MIRRMATGALVGAAVGLIALLIGVVRATIAMLRGLPVGFGHFLLPATLYLLSFAAAGLAMGAAWPAVEQRRAGGYFVGVIGAAVLVAGITMIEEGPPWRWSAASVVIWAGLSAVFGLAIGYGLREKGGAAA